MIDKIISEQFAGTRSLLTYKDLSLAPSWNQPGTAGDTQGPNAFAHGVCSWKPGNTGVFVFQPVKRPKGQPWDTAYNFNELDITKSDCFAYRLQAALPTDQDIARCTAFEFELEVCEDGLAYNMAWQCLLGKGDGGPAWRFFDQTHGTWVAAIQLPKPVITANNFCSVLSEFSIDRSAKITIHEGLTIDGQRFAIGVSNPAIQKWRKGTNYFHYAFQLDSNGQGQGYSVLLKDMAVMSL